jgi:hypothetical protein
MYAHSCAVPPAISAKDAAASIASPAPETSTGLLFIAGSVPVEKSTPGAKINKPSAPSFRNNILVPELSKSLFATF